MINGGYMEKWSLDRLEDCISVTPSTTSSKKPAFIHPSLEKQQFHLGSLPLVPVQCYYKCYIGIERGPQSNLRAGEQHNTPSTIATWRRF
jgi:hypothetical protein